MPPISHEIDSKALRHVAGAFPTGITVVTVEKSDGDIHGMTANSFLSVSLSPPLVAFSVRNEGSLMQHLSVGKKVGISILSDQQVSISDQFAGRNKTPQDIPMSRKMPEIAIVDEALAWYCTEVAQIIPAGDHQLILCSVLDLDRDNDRAPLVYYSGYRELA